MMTYVKEPEVTCPACGHALDISGPSVGFYPRHDLPGDEQPYWIPFIEDIRATPDRLVHAECFAAQHGLLDLIAVITEHDTRMRAAESKLRRQLWRQQRNDQPRGSARPLHVS